MLAPLALVLLADGHFLASPYWSDNSRVLAEAFELAVTRDAADAALAPADDTPLTAAQIPALRAALAFASTAQFDLAATALVAFATAHPRAAESSWALRRAYLYWHAQGRLPEAIQTVHQYETHHAAREPRTAAEFFWSRLDHLASPRRDNLRIYLERHARHGPLDLRIVAEAELAADLWRASCTRPWQGLCVEVIWSTRVIPCVIGPAPLLTARPREPARRREALRHAAAAIRRAHALDLARVAPWRRPALRHALGQSALIALDDSLEAFLALALPEHLDFAVEEYKNTPDEPLWQAEYHSQVRRRDDSIRRFRSYWLTYLPLSTRADLHLHELSNHGSPSALLLGMTRFALVASAVHDAIDYASTALAASTAPRTRSPSSPRSDHSRSASAYHSCIAGSASTASQYAWHTPSSCTP